MEDKITVKITDITPQMAARWLNENNKHNRPIYETTVETYALDMKRGFWALNHQGICFNSDGDLDDGQHRLMAIVRSGKTIKMFVFRNVPKNYNADGDSFQTQMTIDDIKKRSIGDKLNLAYGMQNANLKAAIVSVVIQICGGKTARLSPGTTSEAYNIYKSEIEAVVDNRGGMRGLCGAPALASFVFAAKCFPDKAIEFETGYFTGADISKISPIMAYRNYMLNRIPYRSESMKRTIWGYGLQALMHYVLDNDLKKIVASNQGHEFFMNKQRKTVNEICELVRL